MRATVLSLLFLTGVLFLAARPVAAAEPGDGGLSALPCPGADGCRAAGPNRAIPAGRDATGPGTGGVVGQHGRYSGGAGGRQSTTPSADDKKRTRVGTDGAIPFLDPKNGKARKK